MGRKKKPEPFVQWKINIPATLAALVELECWDPVLQKPRYAERSSLIVSLLRDYVARRGLSTTQENRSA